MVQGQEFLTMDGAITIIVVFGIIALALIAALIFMVIGWKKLTQQTSGNSKNISQLKKDLSQTDDMLKQTNSLVETNETSWKKHHLDELMNKHKIQMGIIASKLTELQEEVKLAQAKGFIDEPKAAVLNSFYTSVTTLIENSKILS